MPKPAIAAPVLPPIHLTDLSVGDRLDLVRQADLEGLQFADIVAEDLDLESAKIIGSQIAGLRADQVIARYATISEVEMERVDVPVWRAVHSRWRDVEVQGSRLGSVEMHASTWNCVKFVGCRLGYLNLRGTTLQDVAFVDCTIDELDLGQATVTRLATQDARIGNLDTRSAVLRHVDLRGADLQSVSGVSSLGGATITDLQLMRLAPLLAAETGIVVTER